MQRDRWLGVELRHLAALEAIASERSFRGAAARLGYVQSAISRQVAYLEQITGCRLIERSQGPRPVHLTDAGQLLLEHANDVLASIEAAKTDLKQLAGGDAAAVRVGVFAGVASQILARAMTARSTSESKPHVDVVETASDEPLLAQLREGAVELVFATMPVDPGPFASCELMRVPWVLVVPADSDLAAQPALPTPAELARLPLIGPRSPRLAAAIEARLRAAGASASMVFRTDVPETAQAVVGGGLGGAIIPRLAVDERDPDIAVVELGALISPLAVGLAWHRSRRLSSAVVEFRDLVRHTARSMSTDRVRRFARVSDRG